MHIHIYVYQFANEGCGKLPPPRANRAIQSAQLELERQQASDSLRKGLEKRPEREELIERTEISIARFSKPLHPSIHCNHLARVSEPTN